jgi:hypothetical protein
VREGERVECAKSLGRLLELFASAGQQFLPSFQRLDVALTLINCALDLLSAFAGQLLLDLLLNVVDVLSRPGRIASIFKWLIAHRSFSSLAVRNGVAQAAKSDPERQRSECEEIEDEPGDMANSRGGRAYFACFM